MPKTEEAVFYEDDRQAVRDYLASDRTDAITVKRRATYCECHVVSPGFCGGVRLIVRATVMLAINAIPFSVVKVFLCRRMGMKVGAGVFISPGARLDPLMPSLIELGEGVLLGIGCLIATHEFSADTLRIGRVRIGPGSVIGAHSSVRCGTRVGARATVGFNSFVNRDVPDGATVGGVPARILKSGDEEK